MTQDLWTATMAALRGAGRPEAGGLYAPLAAPLADVTDWLIDPVERALFAVIQWVAIGCWNFDRTLLTAAVQIYGWRNAFTGAGLTRVVQAVVTDPTLLGLIGGALMLALLLAAIGFALRFLSPREWAVVDLRKVVVWLTLIGLLLSQGPGLIHDLEAARGGLGNAAQQVAAAINGGLGYQNPELPAGSAGELGPLVHLFPATTQLAAGQVDALDLTAAYLFAGQEDINGATNAGGGLPPSVQQQYFTNCAGSSCASPWPDNGMSEQGREDALAKAFAGLVRLFTGGVPALFAVEQSLVYLALAVAAAVLVVALVVSLMFAWFRPTEHLPIGVLQSYLRLFILTYLASLILDLLVEYARYWVSQQNWVAFLGAAVLCVVLGLQPLFLSVGAMRQAVSAALGGQHASAGAAGAAVAGAAVGAASGLGSGRERSAGATEAGPGEAPPAGEVVALPGGSGRQPGELAQGQLERSRLPTTRLPSAAPSSPAGPAAGSTAPATSPASPTLAPSPPPLADPAEAAHTPPVSSGSAPGVSPRLGAPRTTGLATEGRGAAAALEGPAAPAAPGSRRATRRLAAPPTIHLPAEEAAEDDPHVAAMNGYLAAAGIAPITSAPRRNGVDAEPAHLPAPFASGPAERGRPPEAVLSGAAAPPGGAAPSRAGTAATAAPPTPAPTTTGVGSAEPLAPGLPTVVALRPGPPRHKQRAAAPAPDAPEPTGARLPELPAPDLAPPLAGAGDAGPAREAPPAPDAEELPPAGFRYTREHRAAAPGSAEMWEGGAAAPVASPPMQDPARGRPSGMLTDDRRGSAGPPPPPPPPLESPTPGPATRVTPTPAAGRAAPATDAQPTPAPRAGGVDPLGGSR